ncbi:MAG: ABA4-like family protein [Pseudomonadales bacterium]
MNVEQIFSLCGAIAMVGWAGLVLAPRWTITRDWLAPVVAPLLIAVFYIWLMATNAQPEGGGFGTLKEVATLFSVPELLLAGWVHYLAFDLFVGAWEVRDAQRQGVHHLLVIPCLAATLMAGPAGLALYWLIRSIVLLVKSRQHNAEVAV